LDHPNLAAEIQRAAKGVDQVKPSKARKARGSNSKVMFEFCCSEDSALGKANEERNIDQFRLTEKSLHMATDEEVRDLLKVMELFPGADLWG
jgi:trans-2-enoyl-CoA reductase